jgi:1A family penicillin-binding protein
MARKPSKATTTLRKKRSAPRKNVVSANKKIGRKKTGTIQVKKKSAVIYRHSQWKELAFSFLQLLGRFSLKVSILFTLVNIFLHTKATTFKTKLTSVFVTKKKTSKKQSRKKKKKQPTKKLQKVRSPRVQMAFMILSLILTGAILLASYGAYEYIFKDLPSVDQLTTRKENLTTKILDRNGKLLYSIYKDENRTLIPLSRVPKNMIYATIAIEDKNFYTHKGLSLRGIFRALHSDLSSDRIQGGSTITQQLVKNTLLGPEKTLQRKIREAILAVLVESTYSKEEILEMYFNNVPYGGSTYGVEEAAQKYFGKPASQLDLAESALLAGVPAAPSVYSPFGSNPEYAYLRQKEVLRRMVEDNYLTADQAAAAANEQLHFRPNTNDIQAPHFVMYIRNLLEQEYGEDVVNQGGLEVRTTLDLETQNQSQEIVTNEMKELARLRISNGAALVTNPKTGEILAMVGSKNYFDFANDGQVNVTTRPRQPGSSIKPVTYAVALEKGKTPSSQILDEPITFSIAGSAPYSPKNYDGKYHGSVSIRTSLASSYNIPAVKTLAEVGIPNMIDKAQAMGISTWQDRKRFGLSLTLGSGEVLMTDMAEVYGTFANYGQTVPLNPLLEVRDYKGKLLYQNTCALKKENCPKNQTVDPKVAYQITDILSDNNDRVPAFGPRSVLYIPNQQVAVKTGTTNNLRDNWSFGYTTDRLVAVWVGNNNNQPMSYVASGVTGASPIWNKIMRTQLSDEHPHVFAPPGDLVKVKICATTGTLPCSGCPVITEELFTKGSEPKQACNPNQFKPANPAAPGQALPPGQTYRTWHYENGQRILDGIQTQR